MGMKMLNMGAVMMVLLLRFHAFPMLDEHEAAWRIEILEQVIADVVALSARRLTGNDAHASGTGIIAISGASFHFNRHCRFGIQCVMILARRHKLDLV